MPTLKGWLLLWLGSRLPLHIDGASPPPYSKMRLATIAFGRPGALGPITGLESSLLAGIQGRRNPSQKVAFQMEEFLKPISAAIPSREIANINSIPQLASTLPLRLHRRPH